MSEELNQEVAPEQPEEKQETPQLSPMEQKALEQGWRPKTEFKGEPEEFVDAAEFVRRGELFSKIEHQSKELKQVRMALEALKDHHSKVREAEYNRALKSLQSARKEAMVNGEHERAFALEEKIDEVRGEAQRLAEQSRQPLVQEPQQMNPQFVEWTNKNGWYGSNKVMRAAADKLGFDLANEGYPPEQVLKKVEEEIRKEFSHKFQNERTNRPSAVEAPSRGGSVSESKSLSDQERTIMKRLVSSGVMTEKEYMSELKRVKGN